MAPGHAAAGIAGHGATLGGLPRQVVEHIAHAVALDRQVGGGSVDARSRRVLDGERGRGAAAVAAGVCGGEGHRRAARGTAVVAERREVVLDRHVAAVVGRRGAGQERGQVGLVACSVTLYRGIGRGRDARGGVVVDRDRLVAGQRGGVAAVVLTGDGERPRDHRAAVAGRARGILVRHRHLDIRVAVVGHVGERRRAIGLHARVGVAVRIGAERHVGRAGDRERRGLLIRQVDDLDELAAVAAGVRGRVGPLVGTFTRTAEEQVLDRRGDIAASVRGGVVIGRVGVVFVTGDVHLVGRGDLRGGGVHDGEGGGRLAAVAAVVGSREGHRHGTRGAAEVAQRGIAVTPGHGAAVVAGLGSSVVGEPAGEIVAVAGPITLDRQVGSVGVDARRSHVVDGDVLRAGHRGGVVTLVRGRERERPGNRVAARAALGHDVVMRKADLEVGIAVVRGGVHGIAKGIRGRVRVAVGIGLEHGVGRARDRQRRSDGIDEADGLLELRAVAAVVGGLIRPEVSAGAASADLRVAQDGDRDVAVAVVGGHHVVEGGLVVQVASDLEGDGAAVEVGRELIQGRDGLDIGARRAHIAAVVGGDGRPGPREGVAALGGVIPRAGVRRSTVLVGDGNGRSGVAVVQSCGRGLTSGGRAGVRCAIGIELDLGIGRTRDDRSIRGGLVAHRDELVTADAVLVAAVVRGRGRERPREAVAASAPLGDRAVHVGHFDLRSGVTVVRGTGRGHARVGRIEIGVAVGIGREVGLGRALDAGHRLHVVAEDDDLAEGAHVAALIGGGVVGLIGAHRGHTASAEGDAGRLERVVTASLVDGEDAEGLEGVGVAGPLVAGDVHLDVADEGGGRGVLDGEGGRRLAAVAAVVHGGKRHRHGARGGAEVAQRGVAVAPGHGAAVVAGLGPTVVGEPGGELVAVAGAVTLDRQVSGREVDGRIGRVLHRDELVAADRGGVVTVVHGIGRPGPDEAVLAVTEAGGLPVGVADRDVHVVVAVVRRSGRGLPCRSRRGVGLAVLVRAHRVVGRARDDRDRRHDVVELDILFGLDGGVAALVGGRPDPHPGARASAGQLVGFDAVGNATADVLRADRNEGGVLGVEEVLTGRVDVGVVGIPRRSRGVLDGERGRGLAAVAAVVRGREGHRCAARGTAIVAESVEIVGPGHAAADVAGGRTSMAGEPSVEGIRVAGTVALDGLIGGSGVDGRRRRVLNGERGGRLTAVAAVVRGREGHRDGARGPAEIAQRGIAVAPGHGTAVVAGFGTAVVGEPIGEILGVAGPVALDREVGSSEVDGRIRVVGDGDRLVAGSGGRQATVVHGLDGPGPRDDVAAFADLLDGVGVAQGVVEVIVAVVGGREGGRSGRRRRGVRIAVRIGRQVHVRRAGDGHLRGRFVDEGHHLVVGRALVSAVVHGLVGMEELTGAAAAHLVDGDEHHLGATADVAGGRLVDAVGAVGFTGHLRNRSRGERRGSRVLDGEGQRDGAAVAAIVGSGENHVHRAGRTAQVAQVTVFIIMAPRHRTAIVRGGGPSLAIQPGGELRRIAFSIALGGVVLSTGDDRRHQIDHRDGLGVRGLVARAILRNPRPVHFVGARALHIILGRLAVIGHGWALGIAVLTVVGRRHGGHLRQAGGTGHGLVFRSVVERRVRGVIAADHLLHRQGVAAVGVDGRVDERHAGLVLPTGIHDLGRALQIEQDVALGTLNLLSVECTLIAEPAACTIVAVAVVGHFSDLEAEVLARGSVVDGQQGSIEVSLAEEVAQPGIQDVDGPGVRDVGRGHTAHVVLETTAPIGTGHSLIVDDLDVQDGVRVVDVGHLSGDLGYPVLELGQGQSLGSRREIPIVVGIPIHVEEHDGAVLPRTECRGGIAGVGGQALLPEDAGHVSAVGADGFVAGGGQVTEAFDRIVAQVSIECDGVITLSVGGPPGGEQTNEGKLGPE